MPPLLFEYKVGADKPDVTGFIAGVNLTTATITVQIEDLSDGSSPFSGADLTAVFVSQDATGSKVKWVIPTAWTSGQTGEYIGWFIATLTGKVYRSPGFYIKVYATDHTPDTHPFIYGDGRGGYASVNDIVQFLRNRDSNTNKIDDALLETFLGDTAVELDAQLANYYVVPITREQPLAWGILRRIHRLWALAEHYDLLIPAQPETNGAAAEIQRAKGDELLEKLKDGTILLTDATANQNRPDFPSGAGSTISDDVNTDYDPRNYPIFSVNTLDRGWRLE